MSDKQSLEELWQQQPTNAPNFDELKGRFNAVRKKQWLYIGLDVASCVVVVLMLVFLPPKTSTLQWVVMVSLTVFCIGSAAYLTWLRSFTLRNTASNTQAYLQGLKSQYAVNIKIGHYTNTVIWLTLVALLGILVTNVLTNDWGIDKIIRKALVVLLFTLAGLWPARIWANRQVTKYTEEINKLSLLEQSMLSDKKGVNE